MMKQPGMVNYLRNKVQVASNVLFALSLIMGISHFQDFTSGFLWPHSYEVTLNPL